MSEPERPSVGIEQLTEAAFTGVLRALEARQLRPELFPGPIIVGIIAWPELGKAENIREGFAGESG